MRSSNPILIQDAPRSRNELPPLFLIHDASGQVSNYFKIGPLGRRVYGIYDPRFDKDGIGGWQSVDEIAQAYVRLIRKIMLKGEIVLGGWSFGGTVSVNVAHLLATHGRGLRVSGIVLLDTVYPKSKHDAAKKNTTHYHAPALPGVSHKTRETILTALMRSTYLSDEWDPPSWAMPKSTAIRVLRSDPIPPPTILIRASEMIPVSKGESCALDRTRDLPHLGWKDMLDGFVTEVIETSGNHFTIFDEAHISNITSSIRRALDICTVVI